MSAAATPKRARLALTPELVALVHCAVEDPGPEPGRAYLTDADYAALAADILGATAGGPLWVFGYGSLLWKPGFAHVERRPAVLAGWHRAFCLRLTRWRGTRERPGLMLALDRGGSCRGAAFRLPDGRAAAELDALLRREITAKPPSNVPRILPLGTPEGPVRGIAFTINRQGPSYAGKLPLAAVADTLAQACGHWGSGAEYLMNTVEQLEAMGIRDRNLWRLQRMVADRIRSARDAGA